MMKDLSIVLCFLTSSAVSALMVVLIKTRLTSHPDLWYIGIWKMLEIQSGKRLKIKKRMDGQQQGGWK